MKTPLLFLLISGALGCSGNSANGSSTSSTSGSGNSSGTASSAPSSTGSSGATSSGSTGGFSGASEITIAGRQFKVQSRQRDGSLSAPVAYAMKGVAWSPNGANEGFDGTGHLYTTHAAVDAPLMAAAHINTVRTYGAPERTAAGRAVLDTLYANGIMVVMTVFAAYDDTSYTESVNAFKDHPAVLAWLVGNEWNYNHLYSSHTLEESAAKVNAVIREIKTLDSHHPVGTVYGEIPAQADIARVPDAQFWGSNVYPQLDFGNRFANWKALSGLPLFISEYGADAYHQNANGMGQENQAEQAHAIESLTPQILNEMNANSPDKALVGGCVFEWNDEWWKAGAPEVHDATGVASGGVYADQVANEEWWGIVDAQRHPRQAYQSLEQLYAP